ncbi:related to tRNA nucleotidyltransferase [Serendipita indica DSM 11827]|uniref:Related to tRNA nucleotidyltransferase n=1 Tax=Serendipita indica (strain DSM 11827) TaxID=1109443 RepID=G4T829_SERID|nr:related to tRNA nucleotidyltransferase [Serendipita indica DSM 11827]
MFLTRPSPGLSSSALFLRRMLSTRPSISRRKPLEPLEVHLTPQEENVCRLIDEFCQTLNQDVTDGEPVACRIAGGWVRDKLLGIESHDVDIAINTMTGEAFAQKLLDAGKVDSIGTTIAVNPDQSKHLATTRLKIHDFWVDLVNLRSETYTGESRIPTIEFGTPQEDADRRDLTINAMFYNIHSRKVEDFTGRGIDDLKAGIVRTPLEAKTTFEDDPLRILRCVRFASRLGYTVEESIAAAAKDPTIQKALDNKISRERIGEEIDKMIQGPDPVYGMELLHSFGLLPIVLRPTAQASSTSSGAPLSMDYALRGIIIIELLLRSEEHLPGVHPLLLSSTLETHSTQARLRIASILTPFRGLTFEQKKKSIPLVDSVIRDGLKLGGRNHYLDGIPHLFRSAELIREAFSTTFATESRAEIGMLLRHPSIHNPIIGSEWKSSALFSLLQELVDCWEGELDTAKATECIQKYNKLVEKIVELDLTEAIGAPPILNGKQVCETLKIRPGPQMTPLMEKVVYWQLEHPGATADECQAWLLEQQAQGALGITNNAPESERTKKKKKKE